MKTADLVTFTEEILNGKLHFLCSVCKKNRMSYSIKCYKQINKIALLSLTLSEFLRIFSFFLFFSIRFFFHEHSRTTALQGKGEGFSLTPHYHFHLLHRHLDISREITAENSPLHITCGRSRTGNL